MVERTKIRSFCKTVAKQFHPQKIILFGSYASGRPTGDSDVDLFIVMPRAREQGERVSVQIRHAVPRDFPLDLVVWTPTEVAKRLRWGDTFLREIMEKGEVMYEAADT
jgi:predicted nucleotidyltransferase